MKPYYEHGGITIYHGDCRDILPRLPENSIDLIVTDPPYGVMWQSNNRQERFAQIANDHSREAAEEAISLAVRPLRNRRHAYVFGQFNFSGLPISDVVELIWDKENFTAGNLAIPWAKQHEYIQFFASCKSATQFAKDGKGRLTARLRKGSVLRIPRLNSMVYEHPTEKPTAILRQLIESSSCLGEVVLDPFMGVGSVLVASRMEDRHAIGIEIEEKYCEIAAKRLSQEVFTFDEGAA